MKSKIEQFRDQWAGRKFKCLESGEEFVIPDDVRECDFFTIGQGFVDVGRLGAYCRFGGKIVEIK